MPAPDPRFERAARRLQVWDLTQDPARLPLASVDELLVEERFLDFYTPDGLRRALVHYGVAAKLEALGLGQFEIEVERENAYHHRLQIFLGAGRLDADRILDLRLHLREVLVGEHRTEAVGIEWMTMQNPLASFSASYPRLPGQRFPGTQLGRAAHNLLVIMTERIGREALVTTPTRWHLARLYMRAGYRFAEESRNDEVSEVGVATRHLKFAAAAWAVERGLVREVKTGEVYRYHPGDVLLPLSPSLKLRLRLATESIRSVARAMRPPAFVADEQALARSLLEDPVEGLDAAALEGSAWF